MQTAKDYYLINYSHLENFQGYHIDNNVIERLKEKYPIFKSHSYLTWIYNRLAQKQKLINSNCSTVQVVFNILCRSAPEKVADYMKKNIFIAKRRDFSLQTYAINKSSADEYDGHIIIFNVGLQNILVDFGLFYRSYTKLEKYQRKNEKINIKVKENFNCILNDIKNTLRDSLKKRGEYRGDYSRNDKQILFSLLSGYSLYLTWTFVIAHEIAHHIHDKEEIHDVSWKNHFSSIKLSTEIKTNLEIKCDIIALLIMFSAGSSKQILHPLLAIRGAALALALTSFLGQKYIDLHSQAAERNINCFNFFYTILQNYPFYIQKLAYKDLSYILSFQKIWHDQLRLKTPQYIYFLINEVDSQWTKRYGHSKGLPSKLY